MQYHEDYTYYQDPAHEARVQTKGILIAFRYIFKAFIYLPLLAIGYFTATFILTPEDSGLLWLGTILCAAFAAYAALLRMKSVLVNLKARNNPLWVVLFVFCLCVTCLMTPWLAYGPVSILFARWAWPHWLAWAVMAVIAYATYARYDFLGSLKK